MTELRPQYHYFDNQVEAQRFADNMNSRARVHNWLALPNINGFIAYNLRRDYCPMIEELYIEVGTLDEFQDRLNQVM